ncbi:MFS hexose transporter [Colletotrichum salicis]|uniref:MFS hexose transporter n=1 Tax=Colletotrichum salicis TaxID=1209931 RepID=A0A135UTY5_9PEZI|nr:MFS hexose transporter [Colletotrichum salicis]KXH63880.1 MFS hexose transporter [Colletotrichum salicis]
MDSVSLPPRAQTVEEILASDIRSALSSLTPSLVRLYSILAPAYLVVYATNGYDGSVLTGLQGVAAWNREFGSPKGALGTIISTPFSAFVSDRFGRKWSILIGGSIMIIGVLIQCLSHSIK